MSFSEHQAAGGGQPTEEELRAAYEQEIKKIRVEQVLLEHVVTLINLGMRRTGLTPGTESERDQDQVRLAIESVRAQLPVIEQIAPEHVKPIRDALSQLQLAFVRIGGQAEASGAAPAGAAPAGAASAGAAPPGAPSKGATPEGTGEAPPGGEPSAPRGPGSGDDAPRSGDDAPGSGQEDAPGPAQEDAPGPAQRSGRLWVPGQ